MPTVLKYGSLNLLEPSGPVQACNVIALPLPLPLRVEINCHEICAPSTVFCTEFHENRTKVLVAGAMSQTDGRACSVHKTFYFNP